MENKVLKYLSSVFLLACTFFVIGGNRKLYALSNDLLLAIEMENIADIQRLSKDNFAPDNLGRTALMYACSGGKVEVVRFILENDAENRNEINFVDRTRYHAWMYAEFLNRYNSNGRQYNAIKTLLNKHCSFRDMIGNKIAKSAFFRTVEVWHESIRQALDLYVQDKKIAI